MYLGSVICDTAGVRGMYQVGLLRTLKRLARFMRIGIRRYYGRDVIVYIIVVAGP